MMLAAALTSLVSRTRSAPAPSDAPPVMPVQVKDQYVNRQLPVRNSLAFGGSINILNAPLTHYKRNQRKVRKNRRRLFAAGCRKAHAYSP